MKFIPTEKIPTKTYRRKLGKLVTACSQAALCYKINSCRDTRTTRTGAGVISKLVWYQLSKSESLNKGKMYSLLNTKMIYIIFMYTYVGHPCKVNELEYSELLTEVCPLVNGESKIYKVNVG